MAPWLRAASEWTRKRAEVDLYHKDAGGTSSKGLDLHLLATDSVDAVRSHGNLHDRRRSQSQRDVSDLFLPAITEKEGNLRTALKPNLSIGNEQVRIIQNLILTVRVTFSVERGGDLGDVFQIRQVKRVRGGVHLHGDRREWIIGKSST